MMNRMEGDDILSKLNVEGKATIRNKFTFEVEDIRTGEAEKYQANNIVLDQCFTRLVNFYSYFTNIHVGTGTGSLSPTRTTLFAPIADSAAKKSAETVLQERALPTSRWQRRVVINPEELVGQTLTEVGIAYGATDSNLCTHALIEDSEGNPISLVKTDTMVVTIYADIFIELGALTSMYSGKWRWVHPLENNELLSYLLGATYPTQQFRVTGARNFEAGNTADSSYGQSASITTGDWLKYASTKKAKTPVRRLGISDGNGAIRGFGLGSSDWFGTFRGQLPISGVFTGHNIEGEALGNGDGIKTEFNLNWNEAVADSVTVYVDGMEETGVTVNEIINYFGVKLNTPSLPDTGYGCAFSPDGAYLAVAHYGYGSPRLIVIDTLTWETITVPSLPDTGYGCAFSPDGAYLAVAHDGSPYLTVIDTSTWEIITAPSSGGTSYGCAFSPDGAYLAVAHDGTYNLIVIDTTTWEMISNTSLPNIGQDCAFSPDGAYLAVAHSGSPRLTVIDGAYNTGKTVHIIFDTPPPDGDPVTADYSVNYIPKDSNHVLDLQCAIQYGEG